MDSQLLVDTVSRVVHVGTAIALVGGTVFMRFVLHPAAKELSDAEHDKLRAGVIARWKRFVHAGILLFVVSGFYNYFRQMPNHKGDGLYHMLVGTKMLLGFVVFFLASALVGRSKAFEAMRQQRAKWLSIIVLLAFVIVAISGFVKVRKFQPAVAPAAATADTPAE